MIKNYFKLACRNLLKNKSFSFINILGLAIGIAACMIIFLYVQNELTYDRYNVKVLILIIAISIISKEIIRTSLANPVKSLRAK